MATPRAAAPLAIDGARLDALKSAASRDPAGQAKAAAQQFEAVFAGMLIRSMREAMPKSGLGGEGSKMFEGMLDQQRAQAMAAQGGLGLAPVIEKQLLRHIAAAMPPADKAGAAVAPKAATALVTTPKSFALSPQKIAARGAHYEFVKAGSAEGAKSSEAASGTRAESFVDRLKSHAAAAARAIGVPTAFVLGQAALESGWGKREVGADQGVKSHNLFGIKAGTAWKGATVEIPTTEFVDGVARTVQAKFRAYGSYAEAFADYAKLITGSKRYADAAAAGNDAQAFAQGLQKGGYATDPRYAEKLARTIEHAGRVA